MHRKIRCAIVLINVSIARGTDYNCAHSNYTVLYNWPCIIMQSIDATVLDALASAQMPRRNNSRIDACAITRHTFSPLEYLDVSVSEFVAVVCLIDDLGDSNNVALVIADRHRQDQRCLVTGPHINGAVESWILKARNINTILMTYDEMSLIRRTISFSCYLLKNLKITLQFKNYIIIITYN